MVKTTPAATESLAEPVVCTMLFSRIDVRPSARKMVIDSTAIGIDELTVRPILSARYTLDALKMRPSATPSSRARGVSSAGDCEAGTYGWWLVIRRRICAQNRAGVQAPSRRGARTCGRRPGIASPYARDHGPEPPRAATGPRRRLRDRGADRAGRHGARVSRARAAAGAPRGRQGVAPRPRPRRRVPAAVRARGAHRGRADPSEHRADLRRRRGGRLRFLRDGLRGRG